MWIRSISSKTVSTVILLGLMLTIALYISFSMNDFQDNNEEKTTANIEAILNKTLVQCYALEGSYPPNLDYLARNYGIIIDKKNYIYHYEVYGSNIMPFVKVFYR